MENFSVKLDVRLTVGKLKELIKDLPDDMPVSTEGCDCVGPSDGIDVYVYGEFGGIDSNRTVLIINRNDKLESKDHN